MGWEKKKASEIKEIVFQQLRKNINYRDTEVLGLPATYLDQEQFYFDAPFLKDAPFLSALVANPNHIGCHTASEGEKYFAGTQQLEKEVIQICAEDLFKAQPESYDGYIASGGTEANIEAMWMLRNFYQVEKGAQYGEIGVLCSENAHYSFHKGGNLLGIDVFKIQVDEENRNWSLSHLQETIEKANKKYWIVVCAMGTTMFGKVETLDHIRPVLESEKIDYYVHIDAAFGGFIYPLTHESNNLHFQDEKIVSVTLDGHKMLQAPYGTGVFLCKKGWIAYTQTDEAKYVMGTDYTLCGSRSGANAIALWMILYTHGYAGWQYQMQRLIDRTEGLAKGLEQLGVKYFMEPDMNIVTMRAEQVPQSIITKYNLVADDFNNPQWVKIVVMKHVKKQILDHFLLDLESAQKAIV